MIILRKIGDILGGLLLVFAGLIIFLLYFCFNKTAEFAFIKLGLFLFNFCLGLAGIIFGFRRIFLALMDIFILIKQKNIKSNNKGETNNA